MGTNPPGSLSSDLPTRRKLGGSERSAVVLGEVGVFVFNYTWLQKRLMGHCPEFGQAGQLSGNLLDRAVRTSRCRALGNDSSGRAGWGTHPLLPTEHPTMLRA